MNPYVAGGWGATAGMLGLYAARLVQRGRALTKAVPADTAAEETAALETAAAETAAAESRDEQEVRAWP